MNVDKNIYYIRFLDNKTAKIFKTKTFSQLFQQAMDNIDCFAINGQLYKCILF